VAVLGSIVGLKISSTAAAAAALWPRMKTYAAAAVQCRQL
jgi:hypothetical protein